MARIQGLSQREQNKRNMRHAILKAARAKFEHAGIADTTMDEIAVAADVSRATLYNYFPSRSDIVAALVERMDDDFIALIYRHCDQPGSTAERIVALFTASARALEADADVTRRLVGISWQGWGGDIGVSRISRLMDAFVRLLGGPHGADDVRKDVDVRLIAEMLVSVYVGVIHNWYSADAYPLEKRLAAAGRVIAESVLAR
ncbi:TetR/AcrR family transcriptional regulator [Sphingomonas sp. KC8]|uniref:TetR/AcrR family transcriptional regulator n=1 Tax=Sphingomonas sp. KC8 TaxID=1030157 RepID=UPI00024885D1|nr:TetR/AcrR family transcriptional regulator [Sphingomonas sp. KC8]ARS25812.1 putative TetR family transcriptional regulator [Sphingomonas sp. KC8]